MWHHYCPVEKAHLRVGHGEACNWCGATKPRFVVFGIREDVFIETHVSEYREAVMRWMVESSYDFIARVWDTRDHKFINNRVLDMSVAFYSL